MTAHDTPRRRFGVVLAVLAMAAGTAGAIALAGASPSDAQPVHRPVVVRTPQR